jgi:hypothetical protein
VNEARSVFRVSLIKLFLEALVYLASASLVGAIVELFRGARMENPIDYFPANVLFVAVYASALAVPAAIVAIIVRLFFYNPYAWVRIICAFVTSIILITAIYSSKSLFGMPVLVGITASSVFVLVAYRCSGKMLR